MTPALVDRTLTPKFDQFGSNFFFSEKGIKFCPVWVVPLKENVLRPIIVYIIEVRGRRTKAFDFHNGCCVIV